MILSMYSIRDSLTGFLTPVIESNDAVAMRNFSVAMESDSTLTHSPKDFDLFKIAVFDTDSGVVSPVSPVQLVCSGSSFRRSSDG